MVGVTVAARARAPWRRSSSSRRWDAGREGGARVSTLLMLGLVILVGARARDNVRLRQQELVLAKLAGGATPWPTTTSCADVYGMLASCAPSRSCLY